MPLRIDCDSHFFPRDVFDDLDPRFADRGPRLRFDAFDRPICTYPEREAKLTYHQRHIFQNLFRRPDTPPRKGFFDPAPRIEFMDRVGIDTQVLVPSAEAFHYDVDPELGAAVCGAYNNAVARVRDHDSDRFIVLAHLPMQSPSLALRELNRAIVDLGINAPTVFTNIDGRNLDDPLYWDIYARIEELNVPLIIHPSRTGKLMGLERISRFHLENALGFMYEATIAITGFICSGVLDAFPRLRIGILETGSGYLPNLMERLNEVYDHEGVDKLIRSRPEAYLHHFWLSANVSTEKESLAYMVKRYGAGRFMMASDFPHGLGGAGDTCVNEVLRIPGLTDEEKDRILGLNAAELFSLDSGTRESATQQPLAVHRDPVSAPG